MRLSLSSPLPGLSLAARATSFSISASYAPSCTYRRLVERHCWPQLKNRPTEIARAAPSRSASSSTMQGSLPPSCSVAYFEVWDTFDLTDLPQGVAAVGALFRIRGSPAGSSQLTTPGA